MAEWKPPMTRLHCPLCPWTVDDPGPDPASGSGATVEEIVFSAMSAHLAGVEAVLRAHLETHPLEEWAAEVGRLRSLVPVPAPDLTEERWRQGGHYAPAVWAEVGVTGGKPGTHAGNMDSAKLSARVCADHNAVLDLESLLADGWLAEVRRAPAGRADVAFQVTLQRPGELVSVQFSGASPGEAISKARDGLTRGREEAAP